MDTLPSNQGNTWYAPFGVEECAHRLMGLHEGFSFFSFGYANRTTVKIKTSDNMHYQFAMRRIEKTNWFDAIGPFAIRGDLVYQGPTSTLVSYRTELNWLIVGFLGLNLLFVCAFFALLGDMSLVVMASFFVLLGIGVNGVMIWWRWKYIKNQLLETLAPETFKTQRY